MPCNLFTHLIDIFFLYTIPLSSSILQGDPAGDVFFGLFEFSFPILCAHNSKLINCRNEPILNIPDFNVYTRYTVEVSDLSTRTKIVKMV